LGNIDFTHFTKLYCTLNNTSSFTFATVVLVEASLSFAGVGVLLTNPNWGSIIATRRSYIRLAPWISLAPGVVMTIVVLGLNLLRDGLREILDPMIQAK